MKRSVLAPSLLAAIAFGAPHVAAATVTDAAARVVGPGVPLGRVVFDTQQISVDHAAGAYEGRLIVTIGDDGTINGYYRPDGTGAMLNVIGGVDGDSAYLYLGNGAKPIDGRFVDGKFVGYTLLGLDLQRFTAVESANTGP